MKIRICSAVVETKCKRIVTQAILTLLSVCVIFYIFKTTATCYFHSTYSLWPDLGTTQDKQLLAYFHKQCFPTNTTRQITADTVASLFEFAAKQKHRDCRQISKVFNTIYTITGRSGDVVLPEAFYPKVRHWLGENDTLVKEIYHQTIYHVFNDFTYDHTIYNPIRGKRPIAAPEKDQRKHLQYLVRTTQDSCDFCSYKNMTAEDVFGRMESGLSYSAANTFKYDGWHSMFNLRHHDPLAMTEEEVVDMFNLALRWCAKVHGIAPDHRYVHIVWDMTVRGGGSQLHPHIHASLDNNRYYGQMEALRASAQRYFSATGSNYFHDLYLVHHALGYTYQLGQALALAPLTPKKDYEMMILSDQITDDVFKLLYWIIQVYFDDLKVFSFSFSMILPPLGDTTDAAHTCGKMPVLARIIPRGDLTNPRQDISSLEMFTVFNVNDNPYSVPHLLKKRGGRQPRRHSVHA